MLAIKQYSEIEKRLSEAFQYRYPEKPNVKMFGILFAPLFNEIGEKLEQRVKYLNLRTNNIVDFFCIGYAANEIFENQPLDIKTGQVNYDNGEFEWEYSEIIFNNLLNEFENKTTWEYSGESELLLLNAIFDNEFNHVFVDYSKVIILELDKVIEDNPNLSLGRLFEGIRKFANEEITNNPTEKFRNKQGLISLGHSFIESIPEKLKTLPFKLFKRAKHFRIVNLEKQGIQETTLNLKN